MKINEQNDMKYFEHMMTEEEKDKKKKKNSGEYIQETPEQLIKDKKLELFTEQDLRRMRAKARPKYQFKIPYGEVYRIATSIRSQLFAKYDLWNLGSQYASYRGLCEIATREFIDRITYVARLYGAEITTEIIHGEQAHTMEIYPPYWMLQHTWCSIYDGVDRLYVDLTSQQFKWLYKDIPDFYISNLPPRWYLPDRQNTYFALYRKDYRLAKLFDLCTRLKAVLYMIIWDLKE